MSVPPGEVERGCSGFFSCHPRLVSFCCNPVASVVIFLLYHRDVEGFEGFTKQLKLPALKYWNKTSCSAG